MVALSSGWMGGSGISVDAPFRNASQVASPACWWRTLTSSTGRSAMRPASRSVRSRSVNSSLRPLSSTPYSSSSPDHHAFSATATAPRDVMPMNAAIHSG